MLMKELFGERLVKQDAQTGILVEKDGRMTEHALKRRVLIHPAGYGMAHR